MNIRRRISILFVLAGYIASPGSQLSAQEKLDLRLHLQKGDVQHVLVTMGQTVDQTVAGVQQQTAQRIGLGYTFTVTDVDARGIGAISVKYQSVSFHGKTPAGPVDYDSAHPPAQVPMMAAGVAAMVGQTFSLRITPKGEVVDVSGLDRLFSAVMAKLNLPEGPAKASVEKAFRQQFSAENLKSNLQNVFAPFAVSPVAVAETWSRQSKVSVGFPMLIDTNYTLKSRDGGIAVIDIAGKASTAPDAAIELGQMTLQYKLDGNQTGGLQIDERTGWTQSAQISQTLAGVATLRAQGAAPQSVPVTIKSEMKMQAQDH